MSNPLNKTNQNNNFSQQILSTQFKFEKLETREMYSADHLVINEFMASSDSGIVDENGDFSDWIEIYNPTGQAVNLQGWSLTDDTTALDKWSFPDLTLGSDEYLVIFASSKDRTDGELHTNFKLSLSGEYLGLTNTSQQVVHDYGLAYPAQTKNISYGLVDAQVNTGTTFTTASPGGENLQPEITDLVTFSKTAGSFTSNFSLTLSTVLPDGKIYYTTDGSEPTTNSTFYFGSSIPVNTTMNVRAMVAKTGYSDSRISSASYVKLAANVQDFSSDLPIVVLENWGQGAIPYKGWSQTNQGIVQVERQGANFSIYGDKDQLNNTLNSTPTLDTRMGIRVRGAYSSSFANQPYSVETWNESNGEQDVSMFGFAPESDWVFYYPNPSTDRSMFENTLMWDLSRQMGKWAPKFQFVEVFLHTENGSLSMDNYVGVYAIVEKVKIDEGRMNFDKLSEDGGEGGWLVGINRMDAEPIGGGPPQYFHTAGPDLIKSSQPNSIKQGDDFPNISKSVFNFDSPNGYKINTEQRASIEDWMFEFESALYGDNWLDPINGYQKYLDVDSFVDYFILHNMSKNGDGLLLSMWIYKEEPNAKLKMGTIWDLDLAYGGSPTSELMKNANNLWYGKLWTDPNFKQAYIDRWQELRLDVLSDANIEATIEAQMSEVGNVAAARHYGDGSWGGRVASMEYFVITRANAIDATFTPLVSVNTESSDVTPGTQIGVDAGGLGQVYYALDGSDPRLSDGSLSPSAYILNNNTTPPVELISKNDTWNYLDNGTDQGTAWSAVAFNDNSWNEGAGQLGYGDGDEDTVVSYGGNTSNKHITTYFRKTIQVDDPSIFNSILFEVMRDDGAVIYINGEEVQRMNFNSQIGDPMDYQTEANGVGGADESTYYTFVVPSSYFVAGENVIAVEVHQSGPNSSDISFDLKMTALAESDLPNITIDAPVVLAMRTKIGNNWGGLLKREYTVAGVGIDALPVVISEINYNPSVPTAHELSQITESLGGIDASDFEFIEITGLLSDNSAGNEVTTYLTMRVDSITGELFIKNTTASSLSFIAYEFKSTAGIFNSVNWNSLQDQSGSGNISGWAESPSNDNRLVESNLQGNMTLAVGQELSLGMAVDVSQLTGVSLPIDLSFTYYTDDLLERSGFLQGPPTINLDGLRIEDSKGVIFEFNEGHVIPADGKIVVVRNEEAFRVRYGNTAAFIAGQYLNRLSDSGEQLRLVDMNGRVIHDFVYSDGGRSDGNGSSLEIKTLNQGQDYSDVSLWASSDAFNGTPGAERLELTPGVIINEVITHTDAPMEDKVELYNSTSEAVDVSGWFLTDNQGNYFKHRIASGTVIEAGGFLVLTASDFDKIDATDPNNPMAQSFGLSGAHGDELWLLSADESGAAEAFMDHVRFGAAFNIDLTEGTSLGRLPGNLTTERLVHLDTATIGFANSGHRVSDVVISEVMYNSTGVDAELEYIELFNQTLSAIDISGWRLDNAVEFVFPAGTIMGANRLLLVVPFDPENTVLLDAFKTTYNVNESAVFVGPYSGSLSDGGERLQLERSDSPPAEEPDFTPYILQDEVDYKDNNGWASGADGLGQSLHRDNGGSFGNDASSWNGATPTPGTYGGINVVGDYDEDGLVNDADTEIVKNGFGAGFSLSDLFAVRNNYSVAPAAAAIVSVAVEALSVEPVATENKIENTNRAGGEEENNPAIIIQESASPSDNESIGAASETVGEMYVAVVTDEIAIVSTEDVENTSDDKRTATREHASIYDLLAEGEDNLWLI